MIPLTMQATHFVDLMRLFGGEARKETIHALAAGPEVVLSDMVPPPLAEHEVPFERRINRAHAVIWRTQRDAVVSLTHTVLLHGSRFTAVFEVRHSPQAANRWNLGSVACKEVKWQICEA